MTVVNRNQADAVAASSAPRATQVQWSCTVTKWADRFHMFTNGQRFGTVELVIALTPAADDHQPSTLAAWLCMGEQHRVILAETAVQCVTLADGELMHTDVVLESDPTARLLAMTHRDYELVFAQSPLLEMAGFTGGSYDPPRLACTTNSTPRSA